MRQTARLIDKRRTGLSGRSDTANRSRRSLALNRRYVRRIGYCNCPRFTISNERRGAVRSSAARHGQAATIRDGQGLLPLASGSTPLGSLGGRRPGP